MPRRRLLRSTLVLVLVLGVVAAIAQLAGISGEGNTTATRLVFEGTHERWLVKASTSSSTKLERVARRFGGGRSSSKLPGGWYEVALNDEVAAADAESAFRAAGATDVEPVLPRVPYDDPVAAEDPQPAATTGTPGVVEDEAAATAPHTELRSGPVAAPRIGEQWALEQDSDQDLDATDAWQTATGSGAVIAVIDTGVDATHPDLAGRLLEGRDFSGGSTGAHVDRVGHGTAVASVIAANGTSIAGVAPDAKIMPLKVFRDSAGAFSMSGYLSAIRFAADQGVDVINISLGCGGTISCFSQAELDAIGYANDRGVLVMAAAGNGNSSGNGMNNDAPETPDYPSDYELPNIVSVTSSSRLGNWSTWANYGAQSVDLAAPGEGILVASPGNRFRVVSGTSFSAPHAAAIAGLVAAAHPEIGPADIRARLIASVVPNSSLRARTLSGGVANANAALFAVASADQVAVAARLDTPRPRAVVRTPPVLTWTLPDGWRSQRLVLAGGGQRFVRALAATSRALAHPVAAWRSGPYRWHVVARRPDGVLVNSAPATYSLAPRLGAWATSGRIRSGGRSVRLRIGYAATEPAATVRVLLYSGGRLVHDGRSTRQRVHVKGTGSPRRGWFVYDARLTRQLRLGARITVEVRVAAGGAKLTRRFRATVA